jgi:hypothetical protein
MTFICYQNKNFSPTSRQLIKIANEIIAEYQKDGFDLTLRQLYYQYVSRDIFPNTLRNYKNLGNVINDGRLAGLIDWKAIVDRTRELRGRQHWDSPEEIVRAAANSYNIDRWKGQETRPEVWIEKDALLGVFERVCQSVDVSYFSCRGYTSQSEMWEAAQRIQKRYEYDGQNTVILHFGDHDPSGIDMSRDIEDRLTMFLAGEEGEGSSSDISGCLEFKRVALHMEQIKAGKMPPNPAKLTDSRAKSYLMNYGRESWKLDAMDPKMLAKLVNLNVTRYIDNPKQWREAQEQEETERKKIEKAADKLDIPDLMGSIKRLDESIVKVKKSMKKIKKKK